MWLAKITKKFTKLVHQTEINVFYIENLQILS